MPKFEALNWHDSELLGLSWSCCKSGEDSVFLELDYITSYEPYIATESRRLCFHDCRKLFVSCDLGIASPESILEGNIDKGVAFEGFRKVANKLGIDAETYKSYSILLRTSGGRIEIVATGWSWV